MQAIILAAGMGKRLKELTKNNTKCMVEVNGKTLIDRMLHQIEKKAFSRIIIVVGYEGKKLMDYIGTLDIKTPITFIKNPIYDKSNNIYSLSLAKDHMLDTAIFAQFNDDDSQGTGFYAHAEDNGDHVYTLCFRGSNDASPDAR